MTMASNAQHRINAYLASLRRSLRGMKDEDINEIVEELRSHILDKANVRGEPTLTEVDATLVALGNPEELASAYVIDAMLAQARVSRSPVWILRALFRWASLSFAGFLVLLGSFVGYFLGVVFLLSAVLKPLHPHTAGLWVFPDNTGDLTISLRMGFEMAPVGGRDVLGWWIVPLGLVAGCALLTLTTRLALWCARQIRRPRASPQH